MELLQRRKFCREFLNGYNEKLHPQIISKVFEIGLLTLKNKFNKLLFSKEELDEIIKDLSGEEYVEIVPLPPLKKIETLPNPPQQYPLPRQNKQYNYNLENKDTDPFRSKFLRNRQMYANTLKNPNFTTQNSAIYPNWWWNNKEEEIQKPKNNINIIYNEAYNNGYNNYDAPEEEEINDNEYKGIEDEINYQNYQEGQKMDSNEIKNKNYTIKKLTMNSSKSKRVNKYNNADEAIYYEKSNNIPNNNKNKNIKRMKNNSNIIKKIENKQRVKSSKPPCRKINSFNNNDKIVMQKLIKKVDNSSREGKNVRLSKIPKYKYTYVNGRILRIPEENNKNFHNLTMTEPNKY